MFHLLFKKLKKNKPNEKPPYLDRMDELKKVSIVRLKGRLDQSMIPVIDERIKKNRFAGGTIDKNVILDFAQVTHVDSATIAFHIVRFKEFQSKGFKLGFINVPKEFLSYLEIFKQTSLLRIFPNEEAALKELNR